MLGCTPIHNAVSVDLGVICASYFHRVACDQKPRIHDLVSKLLFEDSTSAMIVSATKQQKQVRPHAGAAGTSPENIYSAGNIRKSAIMGRRMGNP
jgi:predicted naringenin-chalcone synthase